MENKMTENKEELLGNVAIMSSQINLRINETKGKTPKERFINFLGQSSKHVQKNDFKKKFMISMVTLILDSLINSSKFNNEVKKYLLSITTANVLIMLIVVKKSLPKFVSNLTDDVLSKINLDTEVGSEYFDTLFDMNQEQLLEEYISLQIIY